MGAALYKQGASSLKSQLNIRIGLSSANLVLVIFQLPLGQRL